VLGALVAVHASRADVPAPVGARRLVPTTPGRVVFHVGLARCRFVDPTRPTTDYATGQVSPGRVLETEVRYPTTNGAPGVETRAAHPAYRHGPYPVIVFAHGFAVTPDTYAPLLDTWTVHGFVVVAPIFPDTNRAAVLAEGDGAEEDVANQPADVAFVTRQVAAAARGANPACRVLRGLVEPDDVGLAGQSDGGETVGALAFDRRFLAPGLRFRSVAVLSGAEIEIGPSAYGAPPDAPALLVVQSATDACNPPQDSVALYDAVPIADKWFLALERAPHLGPYDGADRAAFAVVARATTRFFELSLRARSLSGFARGVDPAPRLARLTTGPRAPALPDLVQSAAACYAG